MKQAEKKNEETDDKEPKEGRIKEAQGIVQGDAKKAGEGLIQQAKGGDQC
jgi:hypothetical protein